MSALPVLLALWALGTVSPASAPRLAIGEYVAELDRLISTTEELGEHPDRASDLVPRIPPQWHVQAEQRFFTISTEPLRRELRQYQADHNRETLDRFAETLQMLRTDALSFLGAPADLSRQRALLTGILSGREFRGIHGPTAFDYLRQRVQRFFSWLLSRAFRSSAIPTVSRILVDLLIALAVLMLAYWMYRVVRGAATSETNLPALPEPASQEWTVWLAQARAAASGGRWRDGVRLAYWCGIAFLEAQGVWRPDRARTPREYLRLLPPASEHLPTLAAMTRGFELVWYGTQDADAAAFAQALAELKKLGCPSN